MTTADYLLAHVCDTYDKNNSYCSYEQQILHRHAGCLHWTGPKVIPSVVTTATTELEAEK